MLRAAILIGAWLVLVSSSGCAFDSTRSLEYDPIPVGATTRPSASIAVRSLRERRPVATYPFSAAQHLLSMVPLLPWLETSYQRLDDSDEAAHRDLGIAPQDDLRFPHVFMRAVVEDLRAANRFEEIRFIDQDIVPSNSNYVLSGSLVSSEFSVYTFSFGLGPGAIPLWILGIPLGMQKATVEIDFELSEPDGRVVWRETLYQESQKLYWLYSPRTFISSLVSFGQRRYGSNEEGIDGSSLWAYHASALRSGMADVKTSLFRFVAEREGRGPKSESGGTAGLGPLSFRYTAARRDAEHDPK